MALLEVKELQKYFVMHHLERIIPAFQAVSFDVEAGAFLMIQGPNGSGKSTLLRCIYRTYLPTSGSALYASEQGEVDLASAADVDVAFLRRTEIGFVTQFLRVRPRVTALEFVSEPLVAMGVAIEEAQRRAAQMLQRFGLKEQLWGAYPTTFSGGEQQKANLARALVRSRRLLLLDEPTASLDADSRRALAERLQELKDEGVAMMGVFHHPEDVAGLIDATLELAPAQTPEQFHVAS
jgi:alpha-D-ribose 1-methylphosphonate 5-triphosphate synthase subunit PhnL